MSELSHIALCCLAGLLFGAAGADPEAVPAETKTGAASQDEKAAREENAMTVMDFVENAEDWRNIDDVVMGGISSSGFRIVDTVAIFEGNVSLENNGGFASVRSEPQDHDLSKAKGLLLRVRGDGKRYAFRLRTSASYDGISYESRFKTVADKWMAIDLAFEAFRPVYRGRQVRGADPLDLESIKTFGFMISDKQVGPFRLEVEWIKAYAADPQA